jgi:hypothetical protein
MIFVMIPCFPDFDLYDDVPIRGQLKEIFESAPVFFIKFIEIKYSLIVLSKGKDIPDIPVTHCVTNIIAADRDKQIQMFSQAYGMIE